MFTWELDNWRLWAWWLHPGTWGLRYECQQKGGKCNIMQCVNEIYYICYILCKYFTVLLLVLVCFWVVFYFLNCSSSVIYFSSCYKTSQEEYSRCSQTLFFVVLQSFLLFSIKNSVVCVVFDGRLPQCCLEPCEQSDQPWDGSCPWYLPCACKYSIL